MEVDAHSCDTGGVTLHFSDQPIQRSDHEKVVVGMKVDVGSSRRGRAEDESSEEMSIRCMAQHFDVKAAVSLGDCADCVGMLGRAVIADDNRAAKSRNADVMQGPRKKGSAMMHGRNQQRYR